MVDQESSPAY